MNKFLLLLSIILTVPSAFAQQTNADRLGQIKNLERIAFGSCSKQHERQLVWKDMIEQTPDLFIWGGDNVYANTTNPAKLLAAYKLQNTIEDYKQLKALVPIIGTWDDHDFGDNNQGGNFPIKKISQQYALDFLEEPINSPRRTQEGIYTSYSFGDAGKKIKIILLDNRYFLNSESTFSMLGKNQWEWLEKEIINSDAQLHLVISGLSVLSPQNGSSEEWMDHEFEKNRLRAFLKAKNIPYIYLAGDKHFASIFRKDDEVEFLSSGMTHNTRIPLRPYVRARYPNPVFLNNYGLIDFAWENATPILTLTVRSAQGQSLIVKKVKWVANTWKEI